MLVYNEEQKVQSRHEIVVGNCTRHGLLEEEGLVLLSIAPSEVIPDEGRDSLAGGRHAERYVMSRDDQSGSEHNTYFWHIKPNFIHSSERSLIVMARLSCTGKMARIQALGR